MTTTQTVRESQSGDGPAAHRFPVGLTPDEFKRAFRNHAAGVAFSVSAEPPLLVFSISAHSSSAPTILKAEHVVVHLLADEQLDLAQLCATSGIDRFADTSIWTRLITGEPYFPAAHAWIRGRVVDTMSAGKSTIVAVQALQAQVPDAEAAPLVYHNRTWHRLGEASRLEA